MKAIFEVEFDPNLMADESDVAEHGGWLETMQYLYNENDMGIFDSEPKLVRVED